MKSTGIVRRIDELGRITIPKETRTMLDIKDNDSLEIFTEDGMILLKKYQPCCVFCGNSIKSDKRVCQGFCKKIYRQN